MTRAKDAIPPMVDVVAKEGVEVQIAPNVAGIGTNVWVNVDGVCRLRVLAGPGSAVVVDDMRAKP